MYSSWDICNGGNFFYQLILSFFQNQSKEAMVKLLFITLLLPMVIDSTRFAYWQYKCYWKIGTYRVVRFTSYVRGPCSSVTEKVKSSCSTHFNGPDRIDICEKATPIVATWPYNSRFKVNLMIVCRHIGLGQAKQFAAQDMGCMVVP